MSAAPADRVIVALIAAGAKFTILSRFVQFRYFVAMFAILSQAFHHEDGHLSSFQALLLSVAGRVGAGNIAGVAVAITAADRAPCSGCG